jgi:hypothetical protein
MLSARLDAYLGALFAPKYALRAEPLQKPQFEVETFGGEGRVGGRAGGWSGGAALGARRGPAGAKCGLGLNGSWGAWGRPAVGRGAWEAAVGGLPAVGASGRLWGPSRGLSGTARLADHYHSDPEHGIIGRRIDTVVADRPCRGTDCSGTSTRNGRDSQPQGEGVGGARRGFWVDCGARACEEGEAGWRR